MESLAATKSTCIGANQEASLSQECESKEKQVQKVDLSTTVFYKGFYFYPWLLPNILAFQQQFQPRDTDIILATKPKCGTTWLKSLVYSIVRRTRFTTSNHPLLTKNPQQLIMSFEFNIYSPQSRKHEQGHNYLMSRMSSPRLFSTHIPYDLLPESIKGQSKCKTVFMARNPFDTVVSYWKFLTRNNEDLSLEDYVESFCKGEEVYGPFWDHVLGYWKESLNNPDKVLFLKYEDMQEDGLSEMKKLANFLGYGFSEEEEKKGVIQELSTLCSIENLKNLEVNKTEKTLLLFKSNTFFRKGKVGDWVNHLSPSMVERLKQVMEEKFAGSGLEFKLHSQK